MSRLRSKIQLFLHFLIEIVVFQEDQASIKLNIRVLPASCKTLNNIAIQIFRKLHIILICLDDIMHIELIADRVDIDKIAEVIRIQENDQLFIDTVNTNVKNLLIDSSKDDFWKTIVGCLLSTQQNSNPESPISKFLDQEPFPLCLEECKRSDLESYAATVLSNFGGIRFYNNIARYLKNNLKLLEESDGWEQIYLTAKTLAELRKRDPVFEDIKVERMASNLVDEKLSGFGPKQSRNFWQWMGYTRYEIPIDSRLIKWINKREILPIKLASNALSNKDYYEMVLDWVQFLCKEANVLPCLLDAAIFSSNEK